MGGIIMSQSRDSHGRFVNPETGKTDREAQRSVSESVGAIIAEKDASKYDNPVTRALRNPKSESRKHERKHEREPNRGNEQPWNMFHKATKQDIADIRKSNST
jgi:hypothetical protein